MLEDSQQIESPNQLPAYFTHVVIAICLLPGLAMWLGVDLGHGLPKLDPSLEGKALVEQGFRAFSGAFTHTLLEWTAFCIALITAEAANSSLIPFTWAISRTFNSLVCLLGISGFLLMRQERLDRLGLGFVVSLAAGLGVVAYGIIAYCANSQDLPRSMFPDQLITRPWDVYPFFLFLLTAAVLVKYNKRFPSVFSHAMLISTIPDLSTQLYMALGSSQLFDPAFQVAHFTKAVA